MRSTGAEAIVRELQRQDVELVFGIPGTHNLELYRHLADSGIRHVTPRHEQGGGYAADAYARVSGKPGVVLTTTGPGLTNVVTAAATAYADSIPMLIVSPGLPRGTERQDLGWLHEMKDQHAHLEAVVDRSVRVDSPAQARDAVEDAFAGWRGGRPRPVHIEVPLDVLDNPDEVTEQSRSGDPRGAPMPSRAELAAAAESLTTADSVVMIVGGGARQATGEVRDIAEWLNAPVVTTVNGKGMLPETHRLSLGASIRLDAAHELISSAGALLVVGSVLGDDELWGHHVTPAGPVVRIDIECDQLDKNLASTHGLHGDAAATLRGLRESSQRSPSGTLDDKLPEVRRRCEQEAARDSGPYTAIHERLRQELPQDTVVVGDSAQVSYFGSAHQWTALRPGQFAYPAGFATLGYGIPGGIGAALAAPSVPVIVLAGDGGTMFTIQEFATAADLGLSLPVVLVNNGGFEEIRHEMHERGIDPQGVAVRSPDFPTLGTALGGTGQRVHGPEELGTAVRQALERTVPTLIEIPV